MKKCVIVGILTVLLTGCADVCWYPNTNTVLAPKLKDSIVVVVPEDSNQAYRKIGRLTVRGGNAPATQMSERGVVNEFFKQARKRGADGVINVETNIAQITRYWYSPPSESYQRVEGYTSSGEQITLNVPTTTPGYAMPINVTIHSFAGISLGYGASA